MRQIAIARKIYDIQFNTTGATQDAIREYYGVLFEAIGEGNTETLELYSHSVVDLAEQFLSNDESMGRMARKELAQDIEDLRVFIHYY